MNINLTLIAQALAFALFIWFTAKFVWPPLMNAVEARRKQIADGLAAAEEGKQSLAQSAKRAEQSLGEAKSKAADIIAQAEKRASAIIEEAKGQAKDEGDRILAGARAEVEQEVFKAKEQLRNSVADLTVKGAEKILRREIDARAHADLLTALKNEI